MRVVQFNEEQDAYTVELQGVGAHTSPVAVSAAAYRAMLDHGIRPDTFDPADRLIQAPRAVCRFTARRPRYGISH